MGESARKWDGRTVLYVLGFALLFSIVVSPIALLLPTHGAIEVVALAGGGFFGWRQAQRRGKAIEGQEGEKRLPQRVPALLVVLGIHSFGALTWLISLGFSSDIGTGHQLNEALGIGAATWLVATVLIVWLWLSGRSPLYWFVPVVWWLPSFLLMVEVVYNNPAEPAGASPQTTLSSTSEPSASTSEPSSGLCKKDGIRYAGTTAQGAEVCFTLTPDRSGWAEIGLTFVIASGCPNKAAGTTYNDGSAPLDGPGRIEIPGFKANIDPTDSTAASGVLSDPDICPGKKFEWTASVHG